MAIFEKVVMLRPYIAFMLYFFNNLTYFYKAIYYIIFYLSLPVDLYTYLILLEHI